MYENEQEEKLKQYQNQVNVGCGADTSANGLLEVKCHNSAVRSYLRERVSNSLYRAETEADRAKAYRELSQLLERNPEVARFLELIEALVL